MNLKSECNFLSEITNTCFTGSKHTYQHNNKKLIKVMALCFVLSTLYYLSYRVIHSATENTLKQIHMQPWAEMLMSHSVSIFKIQSRSKAKWGCVKPEVSPTWGAIENTPSLFQMCL